MQRSPATNTTTLGTLDPDRGADLKPSPDKGAEAPTDHPPGPPLKLEGHRSRFQARDRSAQWARCS